MPFKSSEKSREYHREYQRKVRPQGPKVGLTAQQKNNLEAWQLSIVSDLTLILEEVIDELRATSLDVGVRARVTAQLIQSGCRLLEIGNLEKRVEALEAKMK